MKYFLDDRFQAPTDYPRWASSSCTAPYEVLFRKDYEPWAIVYRSAL